VLTTTLLQGLLGYSVITAGFVATSRAIGMVGASTVIGRVLHMIDPRLVMAAGFGICACSFAQMCRFYLQMHYSQVFWAGVIFGVGIGVASIPVVTIAFATLPAHLRTEGSAVSSLIRSLGGSVSIAVIQTMFTRSTNIMHARLAEHITPYSALVGGQVDLGSRMGLIAIDGRIFAQASMLAYNNMFRLLFVIAMSAIPFAFLFRKPKTHPESVAIPVME
jgi:DHA2 family multidrug resistance protein